SEKYRTHKESIDFAFSSPPYFDLEKYTDEETQSYIRYNNINKWFEGYVVPTIRNIHHMLKNECYYAVNIADFGNGKKSKIEIVDRWIEESEKIGFELVDTIYMKIQRR